MNNDEIELNETVNINNKINEEENIIIEEKNQKEIKDFENNENNNTKNVNVKDENNINNNNNDMTQMEKTGETTGLFQRNYFENIFNKKIMKILRKRLTFHNIGFYIILALFEILMLVIYAIFIEYKPYNNVSNIGGGTNVGSYYKFYIDISVKKYI
jgi:hypothetical protein